MLHFFLPTRQELLVLRIQTAFAQAFWLRETRQDGLAVPNLCCEEMFSIRTLSGKHHCSRRGQFRCHMLSHSICSFQGEKRLLISIETSVSFISMIQQRRRLNCNKPGITWPLGRLANLSPSGALCPRVINYPGPSWACDN